ncbi:hypothetical protein ABMA32_11925 [Mesorhizobium sp. VNQ89]|uniref:hypothetical protein n=1 Tax=Mesorhizobium quangtriensis TaxID=3157709 RepID=UPI0032B73E03
MGKPSGIVVLAGMALAFLATVVSAEEMQAVVLGDITFNYSTASWLMERDGDDLVATCVQEDCRGAMIDISRIVGDGGCTKEAMIAEAARLFPGAGRAYANIVRAGRFALVLAEAHDGPDLSSPQYAHACLGWQGYEYRFAMRPETVGTQSWIGGALHYLVSQATAPEAPLTQLRIGDVTFSLSNEVWKVGPVAATADGSGETVLLTCRMPTCEEPSLTAALSVAQTDQPCPSPPTDVEFAYGGEAKNGEVLKETPEGLHFVTSEIWLGCRNFVPPRFAACGVHGGRAYHLTTPAGQGCRGSFWSVPQTVLIDVLKSARVTE